jgi:two-component system, NarL family, invasion response regulator UvrY
LDAVLVIIIIHEWVMTESNDRRALRVLIADDHAIVRRGLRDILDEVGLPVVIGEAQDGLEAVEMGMAEKWDVIVLDITMPGLSGLEALRKLKRERPDQRVLMLSMHASLHFVRGALQAGASGYLTKETAPDEFVTAIHTVLAGQTYLSRRLDEMQ